MRRLRDFRGGSCLLGFGSLVPVGCVLSLDHCFGKSVKDIASGRDNRVKGEAELKGT